jgi:hypothetical protein
LDSSLCGRIGGSDATKEAADDGRRRFVPGAGRSRQLCPGTSDLGFLGDLNRIVYLDAKIWNRAFDLRMAQQ